MADPSIVRFRQVVEVALRHLEARREEINDLNVYPVADGDTGDNMVLTIGAVRQALNALEAQAANPDRDRIVATVRKAALLGARGNSGAIASQIVRGAAETLATRPGRLIDPQLVADALANAARAARDAVSEPVEGTILTAIDEMAKAAAATLANRPGPSLDAAIGDAEQNAILAEMLGGVLAAGEEAVRRSPEQLAVLAEADTVDAGAHALVVVIRGLIAGLAGDDAGLPELPVYPAARIEGIEHADSRHRWCLNLIVRGSELVPEPPTGLDRLGDSIEVVGDEAMLRVHVHTDDPGSVEGLCGVLGEVSVDSCEDMHAQIAARAARAAAGRTAAVVVSSGEGFDRLFSELGAIVVDGGPTMNPSTEEILAGIEAGGGKEAVVLPNSTNVVLAAQQAARSTESEAVVIDACTAPQLAVELLAELDLDRPAAAVAEAAAERISRVRGGAVAQAARDDGDGRFAKGEAVGFLGAEIIAWGDPAETLARTFEALADGAEVISAFSGDGAPLSDAEVEALAPRGVEVELHDGGQPHYWWLIAAQ